MKRIYLSLLLTLMCVCSMFAATVKVTMNTVSTTMSLVNKATSEPVAVGEPASRVYTFAAEAGTYVLTAYDSKSNNNGTIEITVTEEAEQSFGIITCTAYATNTGWAIDADYSIDAKVASREGEVRVITLGNSSTAGRKTFLALNGDSYVAKFIPSAAHEAEGYMTASKTATLTANVNVTTAIPMGAEYSVTVPADANLFIGEKTAHYLAFTPIEPKNVETVGANKVYTYTLGNGVQYNFRTWKAGGLTQGGIFYMNTDATKRPELIFTDADYAAKSPKFIDHDVKNNGGYNVADMFLNINPQNHLKMNVGEKYDVLAQRNWQLIESVTNNYAIEPDYHYTVQSLTPGVDAANIVSLEQNSTSTDPWNAITAVGKGTVLVTVTYDAIALNQYSNTGVKSSFVGGEYWGAIWPENTGVFVVTVGEDATGITPNFFINEGKNNKSAIEKQAGDNIDNEFDVFYYKKGTDGYAYTFKPEGVTEVKIAYPTIGENAATYAGFGTEGVTKNEDDSYTVLLKQGRQIVALYDAEGKAVYQVLNAKEVEYTISNATRPGSAMYLPGENVAVKFNTVYHAANKLAGIHNFAGIIDYSDIPETGKFTGTSNQYLFASTDAAQTATFTIPSTWTSEEPVVFNGGTVKVTGFGDPIGNHRSTNRNAGRNANFTAIQHTCFFGALPQIEVPVTQPKNFNITVNCNVEGAGVLVLKDGKPVIAKNGVRTGSYGEYVYTAKAEGYDCAHGSMTIKDNAEGDQVIDITLVKSVEGAWDGKTTTEPSKNDAGAYVITTGAEMAWFAAAVNDGQYTISASLANDIDLANFDWTPIGGTTMAKAFKGTFDGNGHTVKGLYINNATATYQGLFGYTYGTAAAPVSINNIIVEGEVTAKQYAAGIAAYMGANVSMDRVGNKAKVTATSTYIGGVTGYVSAATCKLTNAFNEGNITGTTNTGGVAGSNNATAVIENVYNVGYVYGTTVGSIVGGTTAKTNVKNAYSMNVYDITNGQTTVSFYDFNMGAVAYKLGEAFGQKIGKDEYPVLGGKKVLYDETEDKYYNKKNTILAAGDYIVTGKVSTNKVVSNPIFAKFLENDGNYEAKATLSGDEDELIITTDEGLLNGFTIEGDAIKFNDSMTFSVDGDSRQFNVATLDGVTAGEFAITADETDATIGKIAGCKVLYHGIVVGEVNNIIITPVKAEVAVADFEDIEIDAETGLFQPEDEENETAYWNSGDFTFTTYTDDWGTKYYYDFVGTNSKSDKYESIADQYNSAAGGAKSGNNYVVWYSNYYGSEGIYCPDAMKVSGFYVTNTAWVVNAILNGDGMSNESDKTTGQPFGYSGDDKFTLVITGYDENMEETGTVNYVLAESVGNKIYYVKDWRWVDLTPLGDNVLNIQFAVVSTKSNDWGSTTPSYFCMDDFNGVAPEIDAPMTEADVQFTNVNGIKESGNIAPTAVYGVNGMLRNAMQRGINIIKTADGKYMKVSK